MLVSTARSMRSTVAGVSAAPRRRRYCAPGTSASRPSQNRLARNTLVTTGALWPWLATWPRSMKMSSSSVMPTDWPTPAFVGAGAFQASIEETRALALIGENSSVSPTCRLPLSMRPAMMRRWSNLYTSCTVRRSGRSVAATGCGTASSASQQRRPLVPGHRAAAAQVLAVARGQRHERDVERVDPDRAQVRGDVAPHFLIALLGIADEVHLVDRDDDAADAEQAQQVGVAARLVLHAFVRVDHQHHRVGAGGAAHHVLQELLVARGVDQQVVARRGLEADLRGVDGDALVALGLHGVDHERPLERHAALLRHRLYRLHFSVGQRAGLVQQAADQRRLAVVHVTDDHQLQLIHHMYPSARRRSNASSASWSILRPERSETFVVSSSAMISSMVEALLATGEVMSWSPRDR